MSVFVAITLCISGFVSQRDAAVIAKEAQRHGFATYYAPADDALDGRQCAATFIPGDSDLALPSALVWDDSRTLWRGRVDNILKAWEGAYLVEGSKQ